MTPVFKVALDDRDITARIADRLVSLAVTDEASLTSDVAELVIDDRDGTVPLPPEGAEMVVGIGYAETGGVVDLGRFRVDEVEVEGPERRMSVRAKASDSRDHAALGRLKVQRSRSWHRTTLGAIVETIAREHGFDPVIAAGLRDQAVPHADQTEESDIAFLTRLARDIGAIAKPAHGKLLFVPRGEARAASGQAIPAITLLPSEVTDWRVTLAKRGKYAAVAATWRDDATAETRTVTAGQGEPVHTLRHTYADPSQAQRAAAARLDAFRRGAATLDLNLPGRPALAAETRLTLAGFRAGADGDWIISRVEHRLDGGGYVCALQAEVAKS
ncbi:contractile injection system protein, VgrG/Pvc8 family [Tistrella mobilis]